MRILSLKNPEELASQTEALLHAILNSKQGPIRGFLPAGSSAQGTYQKMLVHRDLWQGQIQFLQIDEFLGGEEFFLRGLRDQLLRDLKLEDQAETIHSSWTETEFKNHMRRVLQKPIDFALLGLGPNGHIGFHEPGNFGIDYLGGLTTLTEESFRRVPGAPSQQAFTFGAGSFFQAKEILLLATGQGKEKIYSQFLSSEPTSQIPVTLLKTHPNFTVLSTIKAS